MSGRPWTRCDCGKRGYSSVSLASGAGCPMSNRFRVYRCDVNKNLIHLTNSDRNNKTRRLQRRKFKRTNDYRKQVKMERYQKSIMAFLELVRGNK